MSVRGSEDGERRQERQEWWYIYVMYVTYANPAGTCTDVQMYTHQHALPPQTLLAQMKYEISKYGITDLVRPTDNATECNKESSLYNMFGLIYCN